MDTSETYIKMCDCGEIQGQWKPTGSDFMWNKATGRKTYIMVERLEAPDYNEDRFIWLPRQDQLQEMLGDFKKCIKLISSVSLVNQGIIYKMGEYLYCDNSTSMEQLWLAFVMKEKYNKIWNGENWTKEDE